MPVGTCLCAHFWACQFLLFIVAPAVALGPLLSRASLLAPSLCPAPSGLTPQAPCFLALPPSSFLFPRLACPPFPGLHLLPFARPLATPEVPLARDLALDSWLGFLGVHTVLTWDCGLLFVVFACLSSPCWRSTGLRLQGLTRAYCDQPMCPRLTPFRSSLVKRIRVPPAAPPGLLKVLTTYSDGDSDVNVLRRSQCSTPQKPKAYCLKTIQCLEGRGGGA